MADIDSETSLSSARDDFSAELDKTTTDDVTLSADT